MREARSAVLALLPVLSVLVVLFGGGLGFALLQSLGYFAPAGESSFTLVHYAAMAKDGEIQASVAVTVVWAGAATILSTILGVAVALGLRRVAKGSRTLTALLQVPIAVPHLAAAVLVLNVFGQSGLVSRIAYGAGLIEAPAEFPAILHDAYGAGIILTYILKESPFVALVVLAMLQRAGTELEAVAATLGASPWQQFRHVTLPLVAPPVISAALIVFAFIFGAFEVPFLLGRPYPAMLGVLAQRRFLSDDLNDRPDAVAAGILMSTVSALLVLGYLRLSSRLVGERPTLF